MLKSWKLTPTSALLAALVLLLAGMAIAFYGEHSYKAQKVGEVTVQADILASTVTAALSFKDHDAAQEYVDALKANPEVQAAAIYDAQGALFCSYSRAANQVLPETVQAGGPSFQEDRLAVTAPVLQEGATLGFVYVRTITEPLARRLERYGVVALLITMGSLVVAVLGMAHAELSKANAELQRRAGDLADANRNLQAQIAERERAEEALRQAQKMEVIGQLTGGVAHDFNNLLQVILGNLDALRRRAEHGQDDIRRLADAAIRGAERAAILTQQLLAFSRRQPLDPKPLDANTLVAAMSELLHRTLGESIRIETVLASSIWPILADGNQLENALLNLAINARDAMPAGGKLTVETANAYLDKAYADLHEEVSPGPYIVIAVTDTGMGMSKDVLQKAFDPFFTTKDIGKGSGLGLSQVYGFMRQSGGHAKIYSEVGKGTTVKLYLPRVEATTAAGGDVAAETRVVAGDATHEFILVVEDEEDVREATVQMLRELGYGTIEAADGPTALALLKANPALRLLFTDVGLPGGLNGRQLSEEARKLRPDLKVLFTTGYARDAIVHHGRLDAGVALLNKPFTYADLATKLRSVLAGEAGPAK